MTNLQSFFIPLATLILGFFLGILQKKILEKRVSLLHWLDEPAVFENIPPKTCFQNLHIINKGKLPAKNIRICLNDDLLSSHGVIFKPVTDEPFSEEKKESMRTLKFERLLPEDNLVISFKSPELLPNELLISIKSDEMISMPSKEEKRSQDTWINQFQVAMVAILFFLIIAFLTVIIKDFITRDKPVKESKKTEESAKKNAEIKITTNKTTYSVNDKIEINYWVKNTTSEVWGGFHTLLDVPGFIQSPGEISIEENFLEPGQVFSRKRILRIPKDVPPGQYRISLEITAKNLAGDFINSKEGILFNIE